MSLILFKGTLCWKEREKNIFSFIFLRCFHFIFSFLYINNIVESSSPVSLLLFLFFFLHFYRLSSSLKVLFYEFCRIPCALDNMPSNFHCPTMRKIHKNHQLYKHSKPKRREKKRKSEEK